MSQHDKLGEFMDITNGIEPARLREMCDAERDGRCYVAPCKVGDIVFVLDAAGITEMRVGNVYPYGATTKGILCNLYLVTEYTYSCKAFYDIGKTVFLTREAAEAAKEGEQG